MAGRQAVVSSRRLGEAEGRQVPLLWPWGLQWLLRNEAYWTKSASQEQMCSFHFPRNQMLGVAPSALTVRGSRPCGVCHILAEQPEPTLTRAPAAFLTAVLHQWRLAEG